MAVALAQGLRGLAHQQVALAHAAAAAGCIPCHGGAAGAAASSQQQLPPLLRALSTNPAVAEAVRRKRLREDERATAPRTRFSPFVHKGMLGFGLAGAAAWFY